ncbi:MAG: ABC transporter ATP-binding protein [Kofleriaceae bacterium]
MSARPPRPPTAWTHLRPYRRQLATGVAFLLATNLLFLGIPVTIGRAVDALRSEDPAAVAEIPYLALAMVGFAIGTALTRIGSRVVIFNAARAAEFDLRSQLFGHLLALDPGYHRSHPTGDVMSRLTNDVATVRALWGAGVLNLVNTPMAFVPAMVMMLRVDPVLTLWALAPYPIIYVAGQAMGRRIFKASRGVQAQLGTLSSELQEDLGGIQLIKTYGLEPLRRDRFVRSSLTLLDRNMELTRVRGQMVPLLGALSAIGLLIVLWVGGHAVMDGEIGLGRLLEFNGYVARLVWPTLALGWMLSLLQRGRASWARLEALLATQPAIVDGTASPTGGPGADAAGATVELRGLTVRFGDRTVLDHIDLSLAPGSITAIVGRTGSGKSTLVDALCRVIDVAPGAITVDGRDLTAMPLAELRERIGYAPQEAFLFSTTIADNIAMGYGGGTALPRARGQELERLGAAPTGIAPEAFIGGAPDPRILAAAQAAGLDRDLAAMPEGLATIVGERGITLSGGQRQRVALARALARAPRLLILDDSLSSVDAETEREILGHLRRVMRGRTSVLISHRVAAVKGADQIVVLDAGRVVERGTHASLLAAGGTYAELYRSQLDLDGVHPAGAQA